jgi:hypothetical protein
MQMARKVIIALFAALTLAVAACGNQGGGVKAPTPTTPPTQIALPTPSDVPSPEPTQSQQVGEDNSDWEAALLPEPAVVNAGEAFAQTWRIRNSGTRPWESASGEFSWVFVSGDQMGGPARIPIAGAIPPDEEYAVTVELTAPPQAGAYEGRWQVQDASGRPVGPETWVRIQVTAASVKAPVEESVREAFIVENPPDKDELVLEEGCLDVVPVADATIPDGETLEPGQSFTKIWRVRNSGTCAWRADLGELWWTFVEGNQMDGPDRVTVAGPVSPGDEVDVEVDLTAPAEAGQHQGVWKMFGPDGAPFGVAFWVLIQVPGSDSGAGTDASPPAGPDDAPLADAAGLSLLVWQHINGERDRQGLTQLAYDERLALAAQRQADDCSQRGSCSHAGSDGSDVRMRVQRVGYNGTSDESWALNVSPQNAVDWWLDEVPPDDWHRRMLLSDYLTEVGVGVAPAEGGYYFVAVFGREGG